MAEIRSTIDIVMEKTKDMVMSPEERARVRTKEMEDKARGHLLSLREGRLLPGDLNQLIKDVSSEEAPAFKSALVKVMIEGLNLESDNETVLTGLAVVAGQDIGARVNQARDLLEAFQAEKKGLAQEAAGSVMALLEAKGISGSALRPKALSDPEHVRSLEDLNADFQVRLNKMKEDMLEQSG